jgi:hypothetical protein
LPNAILTKDRKAINTAIQVFKHPDGSPNYATLLSVPSDMRLSQMAIKDEKETDMLITAALTMAMEAMNLTRPMTSGQIMDLSSEIIETAQEDNLALEDVVLFLQKLTRGHYGPLYESMDIPKFMSLFEVYREERHKAYHGTLYERNVQHAAIPLIDRYSAKKDEAEKQRHRDAQITHIIETQLKQTK